jgi:membrane-bound lytic murein transglycosylase A
MKSACFWLQKVGREISPSQREGVRGRGYALEILGAITPPPGPLPEGGGDHAITKFFSYQTVLFLFCLSLGLSGCATKPDLTKEPPRFAPAQFADLPGWMNDNLDGLQIAAEKSCDRITKQPPETPVRPNGTLADFAPFCAAITNPNTDMRTAIETHLTPWRVTVRGSDDGLFTGYYEASLNGSHTQHGPYQTPIRARPLDHVVVDLPAFNLDVPDKRLTGQLKGSPGDYTVSPYPERAGIESGAVPAVADRVLAWVDDPVNAFFLEIQGSGRIALDDGTVMHVGYAERNGQAYTAIGKVLVDRGEMTPDTASMQSIRDWLAAHPDQARDLLNKNKSYIFFRDIGVDGPIGAENVALTPLRSMAIDKSIWSYGLPFYINAVAANGDPTQPRIQRLMVGQDTGGAIKGAVRGDVFWGYGETAAHNAGLMKSRGDMWVFLPKGITPH